MHPVLTADTTAVMPVLRWAGSKRKILPILESYWGSSFKRYVEPFAGSAALFFRLQPERAILGDINSELIEAYEVIRDRPDDVHHAVSKIRRSESQYYKIRDQNTGRLKAFGRAVRFVYLNRHCFNGIYRTNIEGKFNVPYAKGGVIPPVEAFRCCSALLSRASLKCSDFGSVLSGVRAGDFVYIDPPYAVESRRIFREYARREFTKKDIDRLASHLENIHRKGAAFLLSYADCREARDLSSCWKKTHIRVRRHVAGFASARRFANELLITNIEV